MACFLLEADKTKTKKRKPSNKTGDPLCRICPHLANAMLLKKAQHKSWESVFFLLRVYPSLAPFVCRGLSVPNAAREPSLGQELDAYVASPSY